MSRTIHEIRLESALRKATSWMRTLADMHQEHTPELADLLRENVAEYKALMGDPQEWKDAA